MFRALLFFILLPLAALPQCQNSFPYVEDFETGTGGWISGGTLSDWAHGQPSKSYINSAGSGVNCWITGGLTPGLYSLGQRSWVESPCFDFTLLDKPYLSFLVHWDTERIYDGASLQYSVAGGAWETLGNAGQQQSCHTQNWYNTYSITNIGSLTNNTAGWSGNMLPTSGTCEGGNGSDGWVEASYCIAMLGGMSDVRFRFIFGAGTTCNNYDGFAFDRFTIGRAPSLPSAVTVQCTGPDEVSVDDGSDCFNQWTWNFGDPSSSSNISFSSSATHTYTSPGTYHIMLNAAGECIPDTQFTSVINILSGTVSTTDVTCVGDSEGAASVLMDIPGLPYQYVWDTDPLQLTPRASGLSPGSYTVDVNATDACPVQFSGEVGYGPYADIDVELGSDTVLCPGTEYILRPGHYAGFKWQDAATDSMYRITSAGIYSVVVNNAGGCEATDTIFIAEDCLQDILLPNCFTPDGDLVNDVFIPAGSEVSFFDMKIYNRWGEMIFQTDNPSKGWDGRSKNAHAPEGVYVYLIEYSVFGKDKMIKTGAVSLIR